MKIELSKEEIGAILREHFSRTFSSPMDLLTMQWQTWPNMHVAIEFKEPKPLPAGTYTGLITSMKLETKNTALCPLPDDEISF